MKINGDVVIIHSYNNFSACSAASMERYPVSVRVLERSAKKKGDGKMINMTSDEQDSTMESDSVTGAKTMRVESNNLEQISSQYVPRPKNPVMLSAEQKNRVKKDWINVNLDSENSLDGVRIKYYGTYNGCVACMIFDNFYGYVQMECEDDVSGVTFYYPNGNTIRIWNSGSFLNLHSAHERGLLTQEDLKDIEYYYRTGE